MIHKKITILGIGYFGGDLIKALIEENFLKTKNLVLHIDSDYLSKFPINQKISLDENIPKKNKNNLENYNFIFKAESGFKDNLQTFLKGSEIIFIVMNIGEPLSQIVGPKLAELSAKSGSLIIPIIFKPKCQTKNEQARSENAISRLNQYIDKTFYFPEDKFDFFNYLNIQNKYEFVKIFLDGILGLLISPNNVNLLELHSLLKGNSKRILYGIGISSGKARAQEAAQAAINSPLLEELRIHFSKGCIINITGGKDMNLEDIKSASESIYDVVDPSANIIIGGVVDQRINNYIIVRIYAFY